MPRRSTALLVVLAALVCPAAFAQESLDQLDQPKETAAPPTSEPTPPSGSPRAQAEANGYLDNRFQFTHVHVGSLVPSRDTPELYDLVEANVQLKVSAGSRLFVYGDLSLFYQTGGVYYAADAQGRRTRVAARDEPSLRPLAVPSELYASWTPAAYLSALVGKKRITWGSGFAFNPTDLINPPKDPTDPSFQRSGAWLARVEAPFEKFTVSALAAPTVLRQQDGIPFDALYYPPYLHGPNGQPHFLVAARLYALLWSSDVNLIYYFSNLSRGDDDFTHKSRLGLSFSRYFFTDWELHAEGLLQRGTTRRYVSPAVASGGTPAPVPGQSALDEFLPQLNLDSSTLYPRVIVGTRRMFADESNLSIEYYYQADGYTKAQFDDFTRLLGRAQALGLYSALGLTGGQQSAQGGLPQKFSFDPLRRHYLIASYTKPKIADDWTVGLTVIAGLEDLSGIVSPMVSWSATEWLSLSLSGFVPISGLSGNSTSEFSLTNQDYRVLFEARAFY